MKSSRCATVIALGLFSALPGSAESFRAQIKPVYFDALEAPDATAEMGRFASMLLALRLDPEHNLRIVRSGEPLCGGEGVNRSAAGAAQEAAPAATQKAAADAGRQRYFTVKGSLNRSPAGSEYSLTYDVRQVDNCLASTLIKDTRRFTAGETLSALNGIADEIASKLAEAASDKVAVQVLSDDRRLQTRVELAFGESDMFRTVSADGVYKVQALRNGAQGIRFDISGPDKISDTVTVLAARKKSAIGSFDDIAASNIVVRRAEDIEARRRVGVTGRPEEWKTADLAEKARAVACANAVCNANPRAVTALLEARTDLLPEDEMLLGDAWVALDQPRSAARHYERALPKLKDSALHAALVKAATAWEAAGVDKSAREHWISVAALERSGGGLTPETAIHLSHSEAGSRQAWTTLLESARAANGEQQVSSEWARLMQQPNMDPAELEAACGESGKQGAHVLAGECLRGLALKLKASGDSAGLVRRYREAIDLLSGSQQWAQPLAAQYAFELAGSLDWDRERKDALEAARQALDLRTAIFGPEHETTAASLHQVGQLLSWAKRFGESRLYLERAFAIRSRSQSDATDRAATENVLAYVLDRLGDLEQSELHFKAAIAAFGEPNAQASLAIALGSYAQMLSDAGRFRDAELQYRRQLEIYSQKDFVGEQAAGAMARLATVLASEGKFEEAAGLARKGVQLQEQTGAVAWSATAHGDLGIVLLDWGRYAAALEEYRKALELRLRDKPSPASGAVEQYNIGLSTEYLGRYSESEGAYREARDLDASAYGNDSFETALDEMRLAGVLTLTGRYREAAEALGHSAPIVQKVFPTPSVHYTVAQALRTELLLATGDVGKALSSALEALSIREGAKADSEWRQGVYLLRVGRILVAQHREAEAVPYFTRVRKLWESLKVPDHPDIAVAEWGLGVAEGAAGQFDKMESHCRRALEVASLPAAPSPLSVSASHACLAEVAAHAGKFADAVSEQKKAIEIFVMACPRPHPQSARLAERCAEFLEAQGEAAAAGEQRARAKDLRDRHALLEKGS